jgi:sortase A
MSDRAVIPSSGLWPPSPALSGRRRRQKSAFSRFFQREKVPNGRMRGHRLLNLLALLCLVTATVFLGKSVWITAKAELAQILLQRAFTQSMTTGEIVKPWSWADTWPVAQIKIPRIGADAIVLSGSTSEAMAFGPTWLTDTPRPGNPGTTVLSAHRDTHFAFLQYVERGDTIRITRTDGLTFDYRVTNMRVASWNTSGIDRHAKGHHLVLTTCWPFDAVVRGTDRYLVEAELMK